MKKVKGNDIFDRINYLYQATNLLPKTSKINTLCEFYGSCVKKIASKNVLKLDPTIKRNICKKCNILLIPAVTLKVRLKSNETPRIYNIFVREKTCDFSQKYGKREKHVVHTCLNCGNVKRYMNRSTAKKSFTENQTKPENQPSEENITQVST